MLAVTSASESLRLRVRTDADQGTVFKALTDGDEMTEWFAESAAVDLPTSRYEFWGRYTPQGDRPRQALTGHEAGRALRFTWTFDEGPSTVEITLGADDDGTVVAVNHDPVATDLVTAKCFWYVTLANLAAFSEGRHTMPPFDFSVPAQGDALVRTVIDAPVEEVFAALLDPAHMGRWNNGPVTIEPAVGGRYDLGWGGHGPDRITELDQDKTLGYSWRNRGGGESHVRWSLRSSRGATYLTLVQSGFADDRLAEECRRVWPPYLVELKRLLELGDSWQPLSS
jgi:uncharacterized protein YndB with AHSA1/START domain